MIRHLTPAPSPQILRPSMFSNLVMHNGLHAAKAPRGAAVIWPMIPAKRVATRGRFSRTR